MRVECGVAAAEHLDLIRQNRFLGDRLRFPMEAVVFLNFFPLILESHVS